MEGLDMNASWTRTLTRLAAAAMLLVPMPAVFGQERDEYGEVALDDVQQTVARVSNIYGNVSYARGDQPDEWQPADVNVPMTSGDRLYTDRRSRLELQIQGGDAVRLGGLTDLVALNLTDDTKQFAVKAGVASFHVRSLDRDDVFEIDTPSAAVNLESDGDYRFDIDQEGNTRVTVRRGRATVTAGGGEVPLQQGDAMLIDGGDNPRYDVIGMRQPDGWDRWVDEREGRYSRASSYRYVSNDIVGVDDLDEYGRWQQIPSYGMAWTPATVDVGWSPYRIGHWAWQDPWGWTWISSEPWGWAPYHYGRWVTYSSRWFWIPVAPAVRVAYAPACVAFVGGSPGLSVSVTAGPAAFVGWFPLGPREPIIPWWRPQPVAQVNVTNITYVNKTYVTVVNQNTFVTAQPVYRSMVTDRTVVQQVSSAPIARSVPVLPTVQSTRVSVRQTAAARPPAAVTQRSVVARVAPPPAQPSFAQKLAVIRESRAPVAPTQATRLAAQQPARANAPVAVRAAVGESGRMTLQPRAPQARDASAPAARPMPTPRAVQSAPLAGRALATREQPVATAPVAGPRGSSSAAAGRAPVRSGPGNAQPQPARPEARPEVSRPEVDRGGQVLRPTPARPQVDNRDAQPDRPDVQTREPQSPDERARPVPPPARSEVQEDRRAPTQDWRTSNPPSRRVVTPPERPDDSPSSARSQAEPRRNQPPARTAPTARPANDERDRSEARPVQPRDNVHDRQHAQAPPPTREQTQPAERVAPSDRQPRDNSKARAPQGHRPTPPRSKPTPKDEDKPDK
jgi:hypothetical protein